MTVVSWEKLELLAMFLIELIYFKYSIEVGQNAMQTRSKQLQIRQHKVYFHIVIEQQKVRALIMHTLHKLICPVVCMSYTHQYNTTRKRFFIFSSYTANYFINIHVCSPDKGLHVSGLVSFQRINSLLSEDIQTAHFLFWEVFSDRESNPGPWSQAPYRQQYMTDTLSK